MTTNVNHIHHNEGPRRRGLVTSICVSLAVSLLFSLVASATAASAAPVDPADQADPVPPGFELPIDTDLLKPVAEVTGHLSLHCLDETQGGVAVVVTNHSDTPQYVHASAVKIPVQAYGNPPSAVGQTIPAGVTANYVLGKWDNGSSVAAGMSYGGNQSVAQEVFTIQCGKPDPWATVDSYCIYPGTADIAVTLGNSGSADAEFEVGISSAIPGDPAPAAGLYTVKPGETRDVGFDVADGATYLVSVRLHGAPDFLIDEAITFDCVIIDDQAPLPEASQEADSTSVPGTASLGTQSAQPVQPDNVPARIAAQSTTSSAPEYGASSNAVLIVVVAAIAVTLVSATGVMASILR